MNKRCLSCYEPLAESEIDFHPRCSKRMFGTETVPQLLYDENQLEKLAEDTIRSQISVTGVQPKLSLQLEQANHQDGIQKFTIVGLWGGYILKPPTPHYKQLPEVEDLTMHLAKAAKIRTVSHSLIRLQSGNLAYITKRIDRHKKGKWHMEDMCQLTERLTEDKYRGSYEQIAKAILKYSHTPGLDLFNFFEQVLFGFITGNADMHLKNFSLIYDAKLGPILAPAYDLVATALVNPADDEDLALTLNGKKKKIKHSDFEAAFNSAKLDVRQQQNIFSKMKKYAPVWSKIIDSSFVSNEIKVAYKQLITERLRRLKH